ncbi:DUF2062 domain-containing protein [Sneathiella chinensis]|uniref:DUF2062 domain-containing protein n=1 Tax=Sneathiella chinensis TaxID=349750 RepID=A0ABQ5U6Q0_9PROT|nr:DUF2062 domain-containing protein [Sneathiella chinensis]GLQ07363.1 hypothetical protein GCM10007924_25840 [Sneathiella chinensis]
MFQRRAKPSYIRRIADFFWPSIGFARSTRYLGYRLARLPGTPYSLAAGFAFGAAVSVTPFVGLHFLIAGLLAWGFRANILASALGTAFGNPWTFPLIWTGTYNLGYWIIGKETMRKLAFDAGTMDTFFTTFWHMGWEGVRELFLGVIFPMFVGSIPVFCVIWCVFFYPLRLLIRNFHKKRADILTNAREVRSQAGAVSQETARGEK